MDKNAATTRWESDVAAFGQLASDSVGTVWPGRKTAGPLERPPKISAGGRGGITGRPAGGRD